MDVNTYPCMITLGVKLISVNERGRQCLIVPMIADDRLSWWRHQMETFSALLALCAGNSPVTGEFPAQRPVTRSFDVFFDLCLNKRLSKQSWSWWFETSSRSLWRHCKVWIDLWHMKWLVYIVDMSSLCHPSRTTFLFRILCVQD